MFSTGNWRGRGFTLLELLVALSIVVLVLGAAYGAYAAASSSVARCRQRSAVERDARVVLRMFEREVRSVAYRPPDPKPQKPGGDTKLTETPHDFYFGASRDASDCLLRVVTFGGLTDPDAPGSGQFTVTYRHDSPRKRLLRRQIDRMAIAKDDDSDWLCVAQNVESAKVSFYDQNRWSEGWDTQRDSEMPTAVRLDLVLNDDGGGSHLFTAVADIPVRPLKPRETKIEAPAPGPRPAPGEAPAPLNP